MAPIVISPRRFRCGHVFKMCFASVVVSEPGVAPDLEASPDVLTWMWMFRGGRGV